MILSPFSPVCVSLFLCALALRFSVFLSFSVLIEFSVSLVLLLMLLRLLVVILSSYGLVPLLSCSCVLLFSCPSLSLSSCFLVISARPLRGAYVGCCACCSSLCLSSFLLTHLLHVASVGQSHRPLCVLLFTIFVLVLLFSLSFA